MTEQQADYILMGLIIVCASIMVFTENSSRRRHNEKMEFLRQCAIEMGLPIKPPRLQKEIKRTVKGRAWHPSKDLDSQLKGEGSLFDDE